MRLSTCVPGLCQQTTVQVRGAGLAQTLTYTYGEKVATVLKEERLCFSACLHSPPSFCFSAFCPVSPRKPADVQLCERKQAAGLRLWLAWRDVPEKQRPLNCTNTTAEKLQQGPPIEVASDQTKTKTSFWIRVLLDKEHGMHGWIKSQRQMCRKNCYMRNGEDRKKSKWRCGHVLMQPSILTIL